MALRAAFVWGLVGAMVCAWANPSQAAPTGSVRHGGIGKTAPLPAGTLAPGQAGETSSQLFEKGKNAFARGEYGRAIELLAPLLYPDPLLESEGEIVQAHRMLGVAHLFQDQPDDARQEFAKLLDLRPDYRFDPLLDPPPVVDFFNAVLREREAQIAKLEGVRRKAQTPLPPPVAAAPPQVQQAPRVIEHKVERHSFAVNFVPFGAGQFQNGQRSKGWAFLLSQSVLGSVSVAAFTTNLAVYGFRPKRKCLGTPSVDAGTSGACPQDQVDTTDEDRSTWLYRTQMVSGALFWATVIWGVTDAIANFRAEVPVQPDAHRPQPLANQLRVFPWLPIPSQSGQVGQAVRASAGAGLSFRF